MARILCCCGCGIDQQLYSSCLTPSLGNSLCFGCGPKKLPPPKKKKLIVCVSVFKTRVVLFANENVWLRLNFGSSVHMGPHLPCHSWLRNICHFIKSLCSVLPSVPPLPLHSIISPIWLFQAVGRRLLTYVFTYSIGGYNIYCCKCLRYHL